jgi:hypothetical protein
VFGCHFSYELRLFTTLQVHSVSVVLIVAGYVVCVGKLHRKLFCDEQARNRSDSSLVGGVGFGGLGGVRGGAGGGGGARVRVWGLSGWEWRRAAARLQGRCLGRG